MTETLQKHCIVVKSLWKAQLCNVGHVSAVTDTCTRHTASGSDIIIIIVKENQIPVSEDRTSMQHTTTQGCHGDSEIENLKLLIGLMISLVLI